MVESHTRVELRALGVQRLSRVLDAQKVLLSRFGNWIAVYAVAEALAVILAAYVSKLLYIDIFLGPPPQPTWPYLAPALLLAATLYLFLKQASLYDVKAFVEPAVEYGRVFGALATSFLVVLGILYVFKVADWYSRGWFLLWFALSSVAVAGVRVAGNRRVRRLVAEGYLRQRVAIFGTFEFVMAMKSQIERASPLVAVEGLYLAKPSSCRLANSSIDGDLSDLKSAIARGLYDTVAIGLPAAETKHIQTAVHELSSYSTELLLCTELDPYPVSLQGSRNFGSLRTNVINLVPLSERNRLLKSALDYAVAGIGLVLLAPLLALVAVAIKLDSPGPVFFRQRRYGQNNRIFRIFKFRTMAVTEDGDQIRQAEPNDPRVTRVGRILRRTSIDELPQLINVLLGDMSIVGPRPHALAHDQLFEQQLDFFARRRRVRPGLTGWAQVHGYRGEMKTAKDIRRRVQHDLYYIDNWSIWLDIEIIIRTVFVLLRGAY